MKKNILLFLLLLIGMTLFVNVVVAEDGEVVPGEPVWEIIWEDDVSGENLPVTGDDIQYNNFERPFRSGDMTYIPGLDIIEVRSGEDYEFYYFSLSVNDDSLDRIYVFEFDVDFDSRGDFAVKLENMNAVFEWQEGSFVYTDEDDDLGGLLPLEIEPTFNNGNGYESVYSVESGSKWMYWIRRSPDDASTVELAVNKEAFLYRNRFLWNGWVLDDFDSFLKKQLNDGITMAEAGSPYLADEFYPLKDLAMVDNTCRLAVGFQYSGVEVGGCFSKGRIDLVWTQIPRGVKWDVVGKDAISNQEGLVEGDDFVHTIFERPFQAQDMLYKPYVDIVEIKSGEDEKFYYFSIKLNGGDEYDSIGGSYGIEIDVDLDGRGDFLIYSTYQYVKGWGNRVFVYEDFNNDVGGVTPTISESYLKSSDGYEYPIHTNFLEFYNDSVWKQRSPFEDYAIEFALNKEDFDLGDVFLWRAFAFEGDEVDVSQFDFNDGMTFAEAGSPVKGSTYYPLNQLADMDNTCWLAVGFDSTKDEFGVCEVYDFEGEAYFVVPSEPEWLDVWEDDVSENVDEVPTNGFFNGGFENPFKRDGTRYVPYFDIVEVKSGEDEEFYYFSIQLNGSDQEFERLGYYGLELDFDLDLDGDYIIVTDYMYMQEWNEKFGFVSVDANDDVGFFSLYSIHYNYSNNLSSSFREKAFDGNGYESQYRTINSGLDEDMVWVRNSPTQFHTIEFAVKKSAFEETGTLFWRAWAFETYYSRVDGVENVEEIELPLYRNAILDSSCWFSIGFDE